MLGAENGGGVASDDADADLPSLLPRIRALAALIPFVQIQRHHRDRARNRTHLLRLKNPNKKQQQQDSNFPLRSFALEISIESSPKYLLVEKKRIVIVKRDKLQQSPFCTVGKDRESRENLNKEQHSRRKLRM